MDANQVGYVHEPNIGKTRSLSLPVIAKIVSEDLDDVLASPYLVEEEEVVGV